MRIDSNTEMKHPEISVVAPVFNEEAGVNELVERVAKSCSDARENFEIIIVNDGSRDATLGRLIEASRSIPGLRVINLYRNFGPMAAVSAGISAARGNAVITIDGDMQDPPELIPKMVKLWRDGADVVYCERIERAENFVVRTLISAFYWLFERLSDTDIPKQAGTFGLMDRRVVDILVAMPERHRYLAGLRSWIGGRQEKLEYTREVRKFGTTQQGLRGLFSHARLGVVSFSKVPLRLASILSLLTSVMLLGVSLFAVAVRVGTDLAIPGWATYTALIGGMGFVQSLVLGVIAEYLGAIFDEVKARPVFLAKEEFVNGESATSVDGSSARGSSVDKDKDAATR